MRRAAWTAVVLTLSLLAGLLAVVPVPGLPESVAAADTAPGAGNYVPLTNVRILDTRTASAPEPVELSAGSPITFKVAGRAGLPADVSQIAAVVLTVETETVAAGTESSCLSVSPSGAAYSDVTSAFAQPGETLSNTVYTALGSDGYATVATCRSHTDVAVYVQGYFRADGEAAGFKPVVPKRVLDTRDGTGVPKLAAGASLDVSVAAATVPNDAGTAAVNITTIATDDGRLDVGPPDTTRRSRVDFYGGRATASATMLLAGVSSQVFRITNSSSVPVDVLVDVQGFFGRSNLGGGFTPLPDRVFDTRVAPATVLAPGAVVSVPVTGTHGIPASGVGAVALDLTVANPGGDGYLRAWADGTSEPTDTSTLNFVANVLRTNAAIVSTTSPATGAVKVRNVSNVPVNFVVDVQGWFSLYGIQAPGQMDAPLASPGNETASVGWTEAVARGVGVTGYVISTWLDSSKTRAPVPEVAVSSDTRSVMITGLMNETKYYFTVRARTMSKGDSPESLPSNVVTPSGGIDPTPGMPTADAPVEPASMPLPGPGTGTMPALQDGPRANVQNAPVPLGWEDWQSYVPADLGGWTRAGVDVASGNLVVQATDSTAVQAHGHLAYVLRHTYNSQAAQTVTLPVSGTIGEGWQLSLGEQAGDATGVVQTALDLLVPDSSQPTVPSPGSVVLVDRDGTRHTFAFNALMTSASSPLLVAATGAPAQAAGLVPQVLSGTGGGALCIDSTYTAPPGVHAALYRYVQVGGGTCGGDPTTVGGLTDAPVVVGYALVRPDRTRAEYGPTGQIVSLTDAAGVQLRYAYEKDLPGGVGNGRLVLVYEPRSCTATRASVTALPTLPASCRAYHVTYGTAPPSVSVVDPAGRTTKYLMNQVNLTGGLPGLAQRLQSVTNPDGSVLTYGYQDVPALDGTTPQCGGQVGQLCWTVDGRGGRTTFTYASADDGNPTTVDGPPRVDVLTDRRGLATAFTYGSSITTAVSGTHRTVFAGVDSAGRVRDRYDASTGTTLFRWTTTAWDTADARCQQPAPANANRVDHLRCQVVRHQVSTQPGAAPDQRTSSTYNEQGLPLVVQRPNGSGGTGLAAFDVTTTGYSSQYVTATGTRMYIDQVAGQGQVNSDTGRNSDLTAPVLYAVTDAVQTLTPRGNAAPAQGQGTATRPDWTAYLTSVTVDAPLGRDGSPASGPGAGTAPGSVPTGTVCSGGAATGNTGLVCQVTGPAFDRGDRTDGYGGVSTTYTTPGGATTTASTPTTPTTTRFTYDRFGQKLTMATPKALAEGKAGVYRYVYYADATVTGTITVPAERDLSGQTDAGGWLKAVVDPAGEFVAYGYDRAGNVARTWDRNATHGSTTSAFPGSLSTPPNDRYRETLYAGVGSGVLSNAARISAYGNPWRFVGSDRDGTGARASYTFDPNGNVTAAVSPRGNTLPVGVLNPQTNPTAYETVATFDAGDLQTSVTLPANRFVNGAAADEPTRTAYDIYGNAVLVTDPRGVNTAYAYDAADRPTGTTWSRGPYATTGPTATPRACRASTSADASAFGTGVTLCSTTTRFDGLDQAFAVRDGNGQVGSAAFDALGRTVSSTRPRGGAALGQAQDSTTTQVRYDQDGQPVTICRPRQVTDGGGACTSSSRFATQVRYDVAGRPVTSLSFRENDTAPALATYTRYDADGNTVAATDPNVHTTTATFDLLDRQGTLTRPRSAAERWTTTYGYDAVGNRTAVTEPGHDRLGADGTVTRDATTTAYTYDAVNRLVDTVEGASSTDGTVGTAPGVDGGTDTRTRRIYDADGHLVALFSPRAFTGTGSYSAPDSRFEQRVDRDGNGRITATYRPRYGTGTGTADPTGAGGTQTGQCPTGARPGSALTAPGAAWQATNYASDTGVCITRTLYDPAGQPVTVTLPTAGGADPGSTPKQVSTIWTDDGLAASTTGPSPTGSGTVTTRTRYDALGRPLTVTDPLGATATTSWTSDGLPAITTAPGYKAMTTGIVVTHRTGYAYDADGQLETTKDALGHTATNTWSADGLLTQTTAPVGEETRTADGTEPLALTTQYTYDGAGNVLTVLSPSGVQGRGDTQPDPTKAGGYTNPNNDPTVYSYTDDDLLRTAWQPRSLYTDASGGQSSRRHLTTWTYDGAGRKSAQQMQDTSPVDVDSLIGTATRQGFIYHANDRLQRETGRSGEKIDHAYDADGNPTRTADSTNAADTVTSTFYLDGLTRTVTDSTDAAAEFTRYAYDGSGQVVVRQQGKSGSGTANLATYTYRDAGTPASSTSSAVGRSSTTAWSWTHDAAGRVVSEQAPNGQTSSFSYQVDDTLLRKTTRTTSAPSSPTLAEWTYTYDNLGRQTAVDGTTLRRTGTSLTSTSSTGTTTTSTQTTRAQRHTFGYDAPGRVITTSDDQGPHTIRYDADSNRVSYSTQANGKDVTQVTVYNADDSIRTATDGTSATAAALRSTYASTGTLTDDGCYGYTYDGFDRLKTVTPTSAACTNAPSNTTSTYGYDGLDRQRTRDETVKTTTATLYSDGTTVANPPTYRTTHTDLSYDGLSSTVTSEVAPGQTPMRYTLDPAGRSSALTQTDAAGANPSTQYLTDDGYGNITTVTNDKVATTTTSSAGLVACATRYDPWGRPRTDRTAGSATPADATVPSSGNGGPPSSGATPAGTATSGHGLTPNPCETSALDSTPTTAADVFYRGQRRDTGTGNYQMGTRTYDPAKAAFLSQDTYRRAHSTADLAVATDPLTHNRYTYVNGDPVNLVDPTGHYAIESDYGYSQVPSDTRGRSTLAYRTCLDRTGDGHGRGERICARANPDPKPELTPKRLGKFLVNTAVGMGNGVVNLPHDGLATACLAGHLFSDSLARRCGHGADYVPRSKYCPYNDDPGLSRTCEAAEYFAPIAGTAKVAKTGIDVARATRVAKAERAVQAERTVVSAPPAPAAEAGGGGGETFFRTMSKQHAAELHETGRVPATGETFISPSAEFSSTYEGQMFEFTVRSGTTSSLADVGVRDGSAVTAVAFPDMPMVSSGWASTSAFFKAEGGIINIGLGRGTALDMFNDAILDFWKVPK